MKIQLFFSLVFCWALLGVATTGFVFLPLFLARFGYDFLDIHCFFPGFFFLLFSVVFFCFLCFCFIAFPDLSVDWARFGYTFLTVH